MSHKLRGNEIDFPSDDLDGDVYDKTPVDAQLGTANNQVASCPGVADVQGFLQAGIEDELGGWSSVDGEMIYNGCGPQRGPRHLNIAPSIDQREVHPILPLYGQELTDTPVVPPIVSGPTVTEIVPEGITRTLHYPGCRLSVVLPSPPRLGTPRAG